MRYRKTVQMITLTAAFLVLFILVRTKREPLAITLMLALSLGSIFYGKLFCGYLCPFHAYDKALGALFKRLGLKRLDSPRLDRLAPLLMIMAFVILSIVFLKAAAPYTKIRIKLPVLFLAFFFLTFFTPRLWHRYVCPFGLIMRLPALSRPLKPKIIGEKCKRCKACEKVCPTNAITAGAEELNIDGASCILCYNCEDSCKHGAIGLE
ncbi:MAG: 4Fe-4S binding protein [Candidatus Methanofastidiosa archaeon]|nr:4Fe-4S binding protein [Candidatus Methanofastidiosa archaeon]